MVGWAPTIRPHLPLLYRETSDEVDLHGRSLLCDRFEDCLASIFRGQPALDDLLNSLGNSPLRVVDVAVVDEGQAVTAGILVGKDPTAAGIRLKKIVLGDQHVLGESHVFALDHLDGLAVMAESGDRQRGSRDRIDDDVVLNKPAL